MRRRRRTERIIGRGLAVAALFVCPIAAFSAPQDGWTRWTCLLVYGAVLLILRSGAVLPCFYFSVIIGGIGGAILFTEVTWGYVAWFASCVTAGLTIGVAFDLGDSPRRELSDERAPKPSAE